MNAARTASVPALQRSLLILELLAKSSGGLTLSQLARQMGLPRSSLHALLLTFERTGYLHRDGETGRFRIGHKLHGLVTSAVTGHDMRSVASAFVQALAASTGLTTHLAIVEQSEAVVIDKVEPADGPRHATWPGKRLELHCTAVGKALICHHAEADLQALLRHGLLRHNENTIATVRRLQANLAQARQRGYTVDDEETELGARCVGAPVFDAEMRVVAAISVTGTIAQVDYDRVAPLGAEVKRTADGISLALRARAHRVA